MSDETGLAVIRQGSKSFAAASRLFDPATRQDAWRLYAWCRHCDDMIDGQTLGFGREAVPDPQDRLTHLRTQTLLALETDAAIEPVFEALRHVTRRHGIPAAYPNALLDGFAMDVDGARPETLEDTCRYGFHVAGAVGVMMAMVMGVRDRPTLERASDLGIAFQLTNIARDVVEDASNGRVYLPSAWLLAAGVAPTAQAVADPCNREALAEVVARLLDAAEAYYRSARTGMGRLPLRSAWAVGAARDIYRDIGRTVRTRKAGAWDRRVGASSPRKLMLLARGGLVAIATRVDTNPFDRTGLWTMPA